MSLIANNYSTTPYCLYPYCAPVADGNFNAQINMLQLGSGRLNIQLRMIQYNIDKLRILWQIASDGVDANNFTASSGSGDKDVVNLKSDIVEKYWQTSTNANEWAQFDAGANRVISMDTFALWSHNISASATVRLKGYGSGSDTPPGSWAAIPVYANLTVSDDPTEENLIWTSPTSPSASYRYWRLEIDDPTNADDFIRIGRLVGGSALILNGENCLDEIQLIEQNYQDSLSINGFTAIANNRAIKKSLSVTFRDLNTVSVSNYRMIKQYLRYCRDTLKALVIVDPSDDELKYRYSAFGKLKSMPPERHRYIDNSSTYGSLELVWDEAR